MAFVTASLLAPAAASSTPTDRRCHPGHNIPMAMIGTFILAGWFSSTAVNTCGHGFAHRVIAVNTMLAGAAGASRRCCTCGRTANRSFDAFERRCGES
jgi:Amt family ammonium transporter